MKISSSLFGLEESSKESRARVQGRANEILSRYRTLMAENMDSSSLLGAQVHLLELRPKESKSISALQKRNLGSDL